MLVRSLKKLSGIDSPGWQLGLTVSLYVLWGLFFIEWTSLEVDGERLYCLLDDAMISMTYARNLVEGYGLNWARYGDPVEGYTCPLWTFLMIPVNALPIDLGIRSLWVQLLSLALLAINLLAVAKLTRDEFNAGETRSFMPAVLMTCLYYPLGYWSLGGMETGLQALLVTLATHQTLALVRRGALRHWRSLAVVLSLALLLRPDMILLAVPCLLFVAWKRGLRRSDAHGWTLTAAIVGLPSLSYLAFRWIYFGDILPNTYYLKMTGVPLAVRLARGIGSLTEDFLQHSILILAVFFVGAALLARRQSRFLLPAVLVGLHIAYTIYIGSDNKDGTIEGGNRFIAPAIPLVFVVLNSCLNHIVSFSRDHTTRLSALPDLVKAAQALLVLIVSIQANGLYGHDGAGVQWRRLLFLKDNQFVRPYSHLVRKTRRLESFAKNEAVVAVAAAGIPSYMGNFRMVDMYGYNDSRVARMDSVPELTLQNADHFIPGHMKWDLDYLLGTVRPDVIFQVPRRLMKASERDATLQERGYFFKRDYYFRKDSPHLKFDFK